MTHIPTQDGVQIVSNRDEQYIRKPAFMPGIHKFATGDLLFPKDGEAGGTWIVLHDHGHALVLLNGAFRPHHRTPPYRSSRGLILLDIADDLDPAGRFRSIDLDRIEPFTVIIRTKERLYDCRWDGDRKQVLELDHKKAHTWSSCTLYDEVTQAERELWFRKFLTHDPQPDNEAVINYHRTAGVGDPASDLLMRRENGLGTVSITSISLNGRSGIMQYLDLRSGSDSACELLFDEPIEKP